MNKANSAVGEIKIALGLALLMALTGCVGYVDSGGYVRGGFVAPVIVSGPEVYFYGGYERGHDVHIYSHRGFESRGAAHPAIRLPPPPRLPAPSPRRPFGDGRRP